MEKVPSELFNPIFWHILDALKNPKIGQLLIYGGSSAAKTYSVSQALTFMASDANPCSSIIFKKESTTIDDYIYKDFKGFIQQHPAVKSKFQTPIQRRIRNADGTAEIVFKGMDDSEKAKGLAGFNFLYADELDKFILEDWKQFRKRLRGLRNQKLIGSWNPTKETSWTKQKLVDLHTWELGEMDVWKPKDFPHTKIHGKFINKEGNAILLHTTYKDNWWVVGHPEREDIGFLDQRVIDDFEWDKENDPEYYNVYALGNWGTIKTGEEFFDKFSRSVHVGNYKPNPDYVPVLIIDYNNRPYMTCTVIEKRPDVQMFAQVAEFCMKPPNSVESLVEWIVREMDLTYCYYLDDPSGKSNTAKKTKKEARSLSEQLDRSFIDQRVNAKRLELRKAPPLSTRKRAWNQILTGRTGWKFVIDEDCKYTIGDFESLQTDTSGAFVKKKVRDKASGATFEEGGHCADTLTYFFTYEFPELFKSGGGFGF